MSETTFKTTYECPCCFVPYDVIVTARARVRTTRERHAAIGSLATMTRTAVDVDDLEITSIEWRDGALSIPALEKTGALTPLLEMARERLEAGE